MNLNDLKLPKKIYVICTVRNATQEYRDKLEKYVKELEDKGYDVHLPHRDTKQDAASFNICIQNGGAILLADEIHIFFNSESQGSLFDLGMAFMTRLYDDPKKIVIVENEPFGPDENGNYKKSFPLMLDEWRIIQQDDQ